MSVVLRIVCRVDLATTSIDGNYVVEYDPTLIRENGVLTCMVETSPDKTMARRFADYAEAIEYWRQVCPNIPKRDDGKPNRPLTVYSCAVENDADLRSPNDCG